MKTQIRLAPRSFKIKTRDLTKERRYPVLSSLDFSMNLLLLAGILFTLATIAGASLKSLESDPLSRLTSAAGRLIY